MPKKRSDLTLPAEGASIAFATYRFESISIAIHQTVSSLATRKSGEYGLSTPPESYAHFRNRAYKLIGHFVHVGLHKAFHWSLMMNEASPKRRRGNLAENEFHIGLLAMTAAAGEFMSRNKLRDLSKLMWKAHQLGVQAGDLESFIRRERYSVRNEAIRLTAQLRR